MDGQTKNQSILIVDDSGFNSTYLMDILKDEYQILIASNAKAAYEIVFSKNTPDLILLDIIMPDVDGYEVCKKIKSNESTKDIPIIFITGKVKEEDEIYGFSLGAVDYISKPYNPIIVRARVHTQYLELKRYRDYLESISYLDGLTGIPNRRKFNDRMELMWNLYGREKGPLAIVMMDIDNFKAYNDIYGHQAGDECLIKVAQRLYKTVCRKTDFVGRYGGEEFVCILPNTTLDSAFLIAENMRKNVMELGIEHKGSNVTDVVTISLGVAACIPSTNENMNTLIEMADDALYCSKETGRNKTSKSSGI